jgi:Putative prokaryotic signal transducing protein
MSDSLITVATYISHPEADVARSALEAAGIDVLLQSDDCGGLRPHLWLGGIQLLVRAEDAERAKEVLDSVAEIATGVKQVSDP